MSVTLEQLQEFVDKDSVFHLKQEDGTLKEVIGSIKAATEAGVPFKEKGKPSLEFTTVDQIEEIALAPIKVKAPVRRRIDPIEKGKAVQHLLDRHGVEMSWAKDADEDAAFAYHADLDHTNLGHYHKVLEKKDDSAEKELSKS